MNQTTSADIGLTVDNPIAPGDSLPCLNELFKNKTIKEIEDDRQIDGTITLRFVDGSDLIVSAKMHSRYESAELYLTTSRYVQKEPSIEDIEV